MNKQVLRILEIIIMHEWDVDIADHTLKHHNRGSSVTIHLVELHAATTQGKPPNGEAQ